MTTQGGWFHQDDPEYLATRPDDRVSYSVLHKVRDCEHAALWKHANPRTEVSDEMRFGSLCDVLLLEPEREKDKIAICPGVGDSGTWSAKYKLEVIAPLEAEGKICLKEKDLQPARELCESVMQHQGGWIAERFNLGLPPERDSGRDTRFQQKAWFMDQEQAVSLRTDWIEFDLDGPIIDIMDLKTATDPSPRAFEAAAWRLGYWMQAAVYARAAECIAFEHGELTPAHPRFSWLVVGSKPPYTPCVYEMSDKYLQWALEEYEVALGNWKQVKGIPLNQAADFIGYQEVFGIDLPKWVA